MMKKVLKNFNVLYAVFSVLLIAFVVTMNLKSSSEAYDILTESIKSQLTTAALSARELIDVDQFESYNSIEDVYQNEEYKNTLLNLRSLQINVGVTYLYALKYIDGEPNFVFDTDIADPSIFIPYEIDDVHMTAFKGEIASELMVKDEYGSFNMAAVPLIKDNKLIGIVCADVSDTLLLKSNTAAKVNTTILATIMVTILTATGIGISILLKKNKKMQATLERMAHFDKLTGLPNRQYLMDHLNEITSGKKVQPFALFFIDLDNFKSVNDNAGHDAGDALLKNIGSYLSSVHNENEVFRPGAGNLNVAARIGGDEFILVVQAITNEEKAAEFCTKLLKNFYINKVDKYIDKYNVGLSIGVALFPYHTDNFHVLIKYADIAMYHSKNAGKNTFKIYTDDMKQKEEK